MLGRTIKNRDAVRKKFGLPLIQCALGKSFSAATGNESVKYDKNTPIYIDAKTYGPQISSYSVLKGNV